MQQLENIQETQKDFLKNYTVFGSQSFHNVFF